MDTPPLDLDAVRKATAPLGASTTLPAAAYVSPEVFAWEREHFFERSWVCVGRAVDLSAPGDQKAVEIGSEGVLLVRGRSGELNAFFNVCRHRGHQLLAAGDCVRRGTIQCPYHAWVYGLDGHMMGAPRFGDRVGFKKEDYSLIPVREVEWMGWVFINASGDAPDFLSHVGQLSRLVEPYGCDGLIVEGRHDYIVDANWKILTENYHECYHCTNIHPELCKVTPPDSGADDEPDGAWVGGSMDLRSHAETMSMTGVSEGVVLNGLDEQRRRQVLYYSLWANLLISLHPDYVMTHLLQPISESRTRIVCEWLFPPEATATDGFDPSYAVDFWDITNWQDWRACESVQRGISSRGYRQGPLSYSEGTTYKFISLVAESYLRGRVSYRPLRAST
jgi:phenylpropionate dioxygenase-like ring-hydroxylating dioxygenase large terminal subunit